MRWSRSIRPTITEGISKVLHRAASTLLHEPIDIPKRLVLGAGGLSASVDPAVVSFAVIGFHPENDGAAAEPGTCRERSRDDTGERSFRERLVRLTDIESAHVSWSGGGQSIYYEAQQPSGGSPKRTSSRGSPPEAGTSQMPRVLRCGASSSTTRQLLLHPDRVRERPLDDGANGVKCGHDELRPAPSFSDGSR